MSAPTFFASPSEFRAWLRKHHASATELWVGFRKRATGEPSLTWPESVDEALCYGWIDAVRKSLGPTSYMIRFTRRRPTSIWSSVNVRRVQELEREGRMRPAGLAAFAARREKKSGIYAYEQQDAQLSPEYARRLEANRAASAFFEAQAPWYRKKACHWVMSAKQEETRERRLLKLIAESAAGRQA